MIETFLARYGLLAIFFGAGLEGEAVVVSGGIMAARGLVSLPAAMIAATVGSCMIDQLWFLAGRYARETRLVTRIREKRAFARALDLLARHPVPFILGFRFIYGMRTVSPIAIGVAQTPARLFVPLNIVAAALWAPLFTWLGYRMGAAALPLLKRLSTVGLAVIAGLILIAGMVWLIVRYRRRNDAQ